MTHNTRDWKKEFDEQFKGKIQLTSRPDGITVTRLKHFIHQELQKARDEAIAREKQLKQIHMIELDAISCMSLEQDVAWRDHRKQRPNHSELDQPLPGDVSK